ncbi:MAG TPA: MFS transporter [Pseudomonadales bacterium]|nr:MFS transporter [Pseudomonadales bacterium]
MTTPPPSRLRRSLRASTFDAMSCAAMIGCGEFYFPAFALLLGATPLQVGIVATVPILVGSAFQLLATIAAHRIGDRVWVIASAVAQATVFIPIALLTRSAGGGYRWLLGWVCLYWILNLGINPAWNAWMGRMIPPEVRSRYFGRRNVAVHSVVFVSLLLGGFLIDGATRTRLGASAGFAGAFALAASSRGLSAWFLSRQHDPVGRQPDHTRPPMRTVLAGFTRRPYGRLIWLIVLINGAVNISAAYFTPYMLQRLDLSYARFTILNGTIVVARVLSSSYWGEIARNYGNRRALQVSTVLLIPLASLWVLSNHYAFLLGIQLFGGFAWAGFELTAFLNLFDCTNDRNRAQVLSIYNLLNGTMIVVGSMLGGVVMHALGDRGYHVIFVASSSCRLAVALLMLRGVGVKRRAHEHSFRNVFTWVMTLRPGEGEEIEPVVMDERRPRRAHH